MYGKKILALLMALMLIVTALPVGVLAEQDQLPNVVPEAIEIPSVDPGEFVDDPTEEVEEDEEDEIAVLLASKAASTKIVWDMDKIIAEGGMMSKNGYPIIYIGKGEKININDYIVGDDFTAYVKLTNKQKKAKNLSVNTLGVVNGKKARKNNDVYVLDDVGNTAKVRIRVVDAVKSVKVRDAAGKAYGTSTAAMQIAYGTETVAKIELTPNTGSWAATGAVTVANSNPAEVEVVSAVRGSNQLVLKGLKKGAAATLTVKAYNGKARTFNVVVEGVYEEYTAATAAKLTAVDVWEGVGDGKTADTALLATKAAPSFEAAFTSEGKVDPAKVSFWAAPVVDGKVGTYAEIKATAVGENKFTAAPEMKLDDTVAVVAKYAAGEEGEVTSDAVYVSYKILKIEEFKLEVTEGKAEQTASRDGSSEAKAVYLTGSTAKIAVKVTKPAVAYSYADLKVTLPSGLDKETTVSEIAADGTFTLNVAPADLEKALKITVSAPDYPAPIPSALLWVYPQYVDVTDASLKTPVEATSGAGTEADPYIIPRNETKASFPYEVLPAEADPSKVGNVVYYNAKGEKLGTVSATTITVDEKEVPVFVVPVALGETYKVVYTVGSISKTYYVQQLKKEVTALTLDVETVVSGTGATADAPVVVKDTAFKAVVTMAPADAFGLYNAADLFTVEYAKYDAEKELDKQAWTSVAATADKASWTADLTVTKTGDKYDVIVVKLTGKNDAKGMDSILYVTTQDAEPTAIKLVPVYGDNYSDYDKLGAGSYADPFLARKADTSIKLDIAADGVVDMSKVTMYYIITDAQVVPASGWDSFKPADVTVPVGLTAGQQVSYYAVYENGTTKVASNQIYVKFPGAQTNNLSLTVAEAPANTIANGTTKLSIKVGVDSGASFDNIKVFYREWTEKNDGAYTEIGFVNAKGEIEFTIPAALLGKKIDLKAETAYGRKTEVSKVVTLTYNYSTLEGVAFPVDPDKKVGYYHVANADEMAIAAAIKEGKTVDGKSYKTAWLVSVNDTVAQYMAPVTAPATGYEPGKEPVVTVKYIIGANTTSGTTFNGDAKIAEKSGEYYVIPLAEGDIAKVWAEAKVGSDPTVPAKKSADEYVTRASKSYDWTVTMGEPYYYVDGVKTSFAQNGDAVDPYMVPTAPINVYFDEANLSYTQTELVTKAAPAYKVSYALADIGNKPGAATVVSASNGVYTFNAFEAGKVLCATVELYIDGTRKAAKDYYFIVDEKVKVDALALSLVPLDLQDIEQKDGSSAANALVLNVKPRVNYENAYLALVKKGEEGAILTASELARVKATLSTADGKVVSELSMLDLYFNHYKNAFVKFTVAEAYRNVPLRIQVQSVDDPTVKAGLWLVVPYDVPTGVTVKLGDKTMADANDVLSTDLKNQFTAKFAAEAAIDESKIAIYAMKGKDLTSQMVVEKGEKVAFTASVDKNGKRIENQYTFAPGVLTTGETKTFVVVYDKDSDPKTLDDLKTFSITFPYKTDAEIEVKLTSAQAKDTEGEGTEAKPWIVAARENVTFSVAFTDEKLDGTYNLNNYELKVNYAELTGAKPALVVDSTNWKGTIALNLNKAVNGQSVAVTVTNGTVTETVYVKYVPVELKSVKFNAPANAIQVSEGKFVVPMDATEVKLPALTVDPANADDVTVTVTNDLGVVPFVNGYYTIVMGDDDVVVNAVATNGVNDVENRVVITKQAELKAVDMSVKDATGTGTEADPYVVKTAKFELLPSFTPDGEYVLDTDYKVVAGDITAIGNECISLTNNVAPEKAAPYTIAVKGNEAKTYKTIWVRKATAKVATAMTVTPEKGSVDASTNGNSFANAYYALKGDTKFSVELAAEGLLTGFDGAVTVKALPTDQKVDAADIIEKGTAVAVTNAGDNQWTFNAAFGAKDYLAVYVAADKDGAEKGTEKFTQVIFITQPAPLTKAELTLLTAYTEDADKNIWVENGGEAETLTLNFNVKINEGSLYSQLALKPDWGEGKILISEIDANGNFTVTLPRYFWSNYTEIYASDLYGNELDALTFYVKYFNGFTGIGDVEFDNVNVVGSGTQADPYVLGDSSYADAESIPEYDMVGLNEFHGYAVAEETKFEFAYTEFLDANGKVVYTVPAAMVNAQYGETSRITFLYGVIPARTEMNYRGISSEAEYIEYVISFFIRYAQASKTVYAKSCVEVEVPATFTFFNGDGSEKMPVAIDGWYSLSGDTDEWLVSMGSEVTVTYALYEIDGTTSTLDKSKAQPIDIVNGILNDNLPVLVEGDCLYIKAVWNGADGVVGTVDDFEKEIYGRYVGYDLL